MLHCWMVVARRPDKGVQHWKLGFEALCIRADGHRRKKRTIGQKLACSIYRCQHLMNKCTNWVYPYHMEQRMKVDEDYSKFEASPSEQEVWRRSLAEKRALEVGESGNNATQKVARAAKK